MLLCAVLALRLAKDSVVFHALSYVLLSLEVPLMSADRFSGGFCFPILPLVQTLYVSSKYTHQNKKHI